MSVFSSTSFATRSGLFMAILKQRPAARRLNFIRRSLDAFARLDTIAAAAVVEEDRQIDEEFRAFVRKLISYMMEDPHTITTGLDMLTIAKAIERIGDHAKNIAEFVIYIAKGADVRHIPHEDLVREANK